jgi:LuxR family transcriptional regulator, maltose regulon positive regulatory protein
MTSQSVLTLEPKLQPQLGADAQVPRTALLDRLAASSGTPVAAVLAPPGYGKTTLLAQWAERDPRAFGWLTIDRGDNDPGVLLRNLAAVVDRIEPVGPALLETPDARRAVAVDTVLPQLGSALASAELPAVLVLDDVHLLENRDCLDAVTRLIDYLPAGSQLALASRGEPPLPLARLRAEGRMVEVGPDDLAMDSQEAGSLLEHGHVDADGVDVAELVRRTEGWPVALHFAALSLGTGRRRAAREVAPASDDRFLVDYLQYELLSRLPARQVRFLTRCSVLERLSGPLCDAVLATTGSADLLESLSRSNLLTTPLDRRRRWYRLHRLFRELLRGRLERQDPALALELTRRAAGWCEGNGLPEQAIEYAIAAGDADRAARVVAATALPAYADGRLGRLERWLGWFEANRLVDRYPTVAALGAWVNALTGHPAAAERWAEAAGRAPSGADGPGGVAPEGPLALLRAASCRDGVGQMGRDAERALAEVPTGSPWQAWAQLLLGIARLLAGDPDAADHRLADAADVGEDAGVDAVVVALAERSLLAMNRGDWQQAEALTERAVAAARRAWLEQYPSGALLRAVTARLAIHRGDVAGARDDLARAERLGAGLTWALPHLAVQVRLELARNYLALTDAAAARTVLREVDDLLAHRPRLGILGDQAAALRAQLDAMRAAAVGAASLTAAELRLLRLLGTHFSFREIGDQLQLSQHTVKSQAMSIYRKFGMSSRSEAIRHARDLGLLVE